MSRERFEELVGDAIVSLPQDMKAMLRVVEDPDLSDEARVKVAGSLLHVLSGQNAIPGMVGILAHVGDVLVLRLVLEQIEKKDDTAVIARHREDSPELFGSMDELLAETRDYVGDAMTVLDEAAAGVGKLNHQGHTAQQCAEDDDASTWLYDAVQEAIVEQLEFDEDEVAREIKQIDRILPALKTRVSVVS
jgi:uncharacterized membrane protein YkvA (DUF1232 family)